jgi:hypothetical protein
MLVVLLQAAGPVSATHWGMVATPRWQENPGFSHQSWGFETRPQWRKVDLDRDGANDAYLMQEGGYGPDVTAANPFGQAAMFRSAFGDAFAWDWIDQGPMERDWVGLQGMIGGMGTGSLDFRVPAAAGQGCGREIWLQYIIYLPNGQEGSAAAAVLAADEAFAAPRGRQVEKSWHRIQALDDQGGSGQWWRVTELWRVQGPAGTDFVRIQTADKDKQKTAVSIIDSVDIMTRSIDEGEQD